MSPLIAWPPLSAQTIAALQRLETATDFSTVLDDHAFVEDVARQRSLPSLLVMLPGAGLYALLYGGAQLLGWLRGPAFFVNLGWMLIIVAAGLGSNFIRGEQAAKDEARIGKALSKWRMESEARLP
ncbi:MAG: hypothetical protein HY054_08650 [Proteobacteria bacterium]|nr:hypothetical protein [Pseudomonadota bacterium]